MKNKIISIISVISMLFMLNIVRVDAANGVYIKADSSTLKVGQSTTVTVSTDDNHSFSGSASASGAGSGSLSGIGLFTGSSQSFTVKATSVGTITVTASGVSSNIYDPSVGLSGYAQTTITVVGDSGGNNSGGGNSGGGSNNSGGGSNNSGGGSTGGGNTANPGKVETEAERIAREEREAEEAKAAEAKKVLISSIEVKSNSDKRRDQVLTEITTEDDNFEYSYNLPTFVDNVIINAVGIDEEVKLEYDTEHLVTEEKKVTIKASKGDISQEYTLTLAPSEREIIKKDDGYIYQDEKLDEAFEALGFEITEIETDGQKTSMFTKGEMHLQMIMDEENQIQFYRLDSNGVTQDKGQLLVVGEDVLFVTSEVSEELSNKTLYGNGYKEVELPLPEFVKEVDESLKLSNNVKGWTYDENKVVNALDTELKSDLYNLNQENDIKAAVVAFDGTSNVMFYSLIGVSVAFVLTLIGLIVMILKYRKEVTQVRV